MVQNSYTYDRTGQRLSNQITSADGTNRTELYGYDELNRLKTVDYGDGQTQSYAFDAMGNRASKVDSSTGTEGYTFNAANMLLTRAGNSYANDLAGNTLTGGGRTNTWDSQNRLVTCVNGSNSSSFVYGADGLRRQSTTTVSQPGKRKSFTRRRIQRLSRQRC
jgi:YD repeat-containing protein